MLKWNELVEGFDTSKWNIIADYQMLVERRMRIAAVKFAEFNRLDPLAYTHWSNLAPLPVYRTPYLFQRPVPSVASQVDSFHAYVSSTGNVGELPPTLDVEDRTLTRSQVIECIDRTKARFKTNRLIIYTSESVWNALNMPDYGDQHLTLIANYPYSLQGADPDNDLPAKIEAASRYFPRNPKGLGAWDGWQYTESGNGQKYGYKWPDSKRIDLHVWRMDDAMLQQLADGNYVPPTPLPQPKDIWADTPLPEWKGKAMRIQSFGLNLRSTPEVTSSNKFRIAYKNDILPITDMVKTETHIWVQSGYKQYAALESKEGKVFGEIVEAE